MGKVKVEKITADESWQVFDTTARRLLGISGEDFAERWDRGVYAKRDDIDVMKVAMSRPSGR
jgi:hypothetical protein